MAYVPIKMTEASPLPRQLSQALVVSVTLWAEVVFGHQSQTREAFSVEKEQGKTDLPLF